MLLSFITKYFISKSIGLGKYPGSQKAALKKDIINIRELKEAIEKIAMATTLNLKGKNSSMNSLL